MNDELFSNNSSGVRGVHWNNRDQKWCAQITIKGKLINLGRFISLEQAAAARKRAEQKYGFLAKTAK